MGRLVAAVSETAATGVYGIHAVDGMAGIGKTAFAVHAAHQLAARFPDGQIFLRLHAHTAGHQPVDPAEALATLLLTTGVAPQQIPPGLEARSATWRGHLAGKKVLLVLDDATGSDQVRPLLPGAAGCLVLVTSRRRLSGMEEAAPVSLGTLPPGEAADLFVRLAGRSRLQPTDAAVAEVTGLCGYLPLGIRLVAAGLCHHPAWTVADLAAELANARDRLAALRAEDVSVAAAFDLSYQDLTAGQQRLFRRLGLHPGADIDAYAAAALDGNDLQATRRRLGELYDHNLLGEPARGRYRLHDLLREYARARAAADDAADNQAAIGRLLDYYLHSAMAASRHIAWRISVADPPSPPHRPAWAPELRTEAEAIAWLRTERPTLHACVDYAAAHGRRVARHPDPRRDQRLPPRPRPLERGGHPRPGRPHRCVHDCRPGEPSRCPLQSGHRARSRGRLPSRRHEPGPGSAACSATSATAAAKPGPSTSSASCNSRPGTTGPPRPARPRRCACSGTSATAKAKPGPLTTSALCSCSSGTTRPPPPARPRRCSCTATLATAKAKPGHSTTSAPCSSALGTTGPPRPARPRRCACSGTLATAAAKPGPSISSASWNG